MRRSLAVCSIALTIASAPLFAAQKARKAAPVGTIEYAYLDLHVYAHFLRETPASGGFDREYSTEVRVCYTQRDGCRWEFIREAVSVHETGQKPLGASSAPVWTDAAEKLTAEVVAKLGADSWELIGQSARSNLFDVSAAAPVLWFKRIRASALP